MPLNEEDARVLRERISDSERKRRTEASAGCVLLPTFVGDISRAGGQSEWEFVRAVRDRAVHKATIRKIREREKSGGSVAAGLFDFFGIVTSKHRAKECRQRVFEGTSSSWGEILSENEAQELEREAKRMKTKNASSPNGDAYIEEDMIKIN